MRRRPRRAWSPYLPGCGPSAGSGSSAGVSPSESGSGRCRSSASFRRNNRPSPLYFSCARIPVEFGDPASLMPGVGRRLYQIPGEGIARGARRRRAGRLLWDAGERFDVMAIKTAFVVAAAHAALKAQVARINALNVYPVPDGDTGTNMLLTLESVLKETSDNTYKTPEAASKAGARAALMGACEVLAERTSLTAEAFAAALEGARDQAYDSVGQPVEGTMLTVIKDAARAARDGLEDENADLPTVIRAADREAHASVRRTPELLGVLCEAGVVDAGGVGVAVILDGIYACATGQEIEEPAEEVEETPDLDAIHAYEEAWGYCTEFVVTGFSGDAREFEDHINSSGKSVLVVADEDLVKVHVHTQNPGATLSNAGD